MSWTVEVLHYATGQVPGAQVTFLDGYDAWQEFHFHVFLLRDGDHVVLLDTGIDDLAPFNRMLEPALGERGLLRPAGPGVSVRSLLAERDLAPEDVDFVALSHLHIDHAANIPMFTEAKFLMSREGYERHKDLQRRVPEMVPDPVFPAAAIEFLEQPGRDRLQLLEDGETGLPGLTIKYLGGHTADCAAYVAQTDGGDVIFPSDTAWTLRNLRDHHPPGSVVDIAQSYEAFTWLDGLEGTVLPPHEAGLADLLAGNAAG
jgi:glyoxylase-like metal-dependent hydrolase (beta-lactamase superfamily II)